MCIISPLDFLSPNQMIFFLVSSHHWFPTLLVFTSEMSSESSCVKSLAPSAAVLRGGTPRCDPIMIICMYDNIHKNEVTAEWPLRGKPSGRRKVTRAVLLKDVFFPASSLPVCSLAAMWIGVSSATHPLFHNSLPPVKLKATESADLGLKSVQMNQKKNHFPPLGFSSRVSCPRDKNWLASHSCTVLRSTEVFLLSVALSAGERRPTLCRWHF